MQGAVSVPVDTNARTAKAFHEETQTTGPAVPGGSGAVAVLPAAVVRYVAVCCGGRRGAVRVVPLHDPAPVELVGTRDSKASIYQFRNNALCGRAHSRQHVHGACDKQSMVVIANWWSNRAVPHIASTSPFRQWNGPPPASTRTRAGGVRRY